MSSEKKFMQRTKLIPFRLFCALLLIGLVVPACAQSKYKKGDEVIVDVYGDGREVVNGVIEAVYDFSPPKYSVRYTTKYGDSQSVYVAESQVRLRSGTRPSNPNPGRRNGGSEPGREPSPGTPVQPRETNTTDDSLKYFFGQWDVFAYTYKGSPPLIIESKRTYKWVSKAYGTEVIKGDWRPATKKETGGPPGIVLLNARDGNDWVVYEYIAPCTPKYKDNKGCTEIRDRIQIDGTGLNGSGRSLTAKRLSP